MSDTPNDPSALSPRQQIDADLDAWQVLHNRSDEAQTALKTANAALADANASVLAAQSAADVAHAALALAKSKIQDDFTKLPD